MIIKSKIEPCITLRIDEKDITLTLQNARYLQSTLELEIELLRTITRKDGYEMKTYA